MNYEKSWIIRLFKTVSTSSISVAFCRFSSCKCRRSLKTSRDLLKNFWGHQWHQYSLCESLRLLHIDGGNENCPNLVFRWTLCKMHSKFKRHLSRFFCVFNFLHVNSEIWIRSESFQASFKAFKETRI